MGRVRRAHKKDSDFDSFDLHSSKSAYVPPMTKKAGAAGSLVSLPIDFSPAFVVKERTAHLLNSKC